MASTSAAIDILGSTSCIVPASLSHLLASNSIEAPAMSRARARARARAAIAAAVKSGVAYMRVCVCDAAGQLSSSSCSWLSY